MKQRVRCVIIQALALSQQERSRQERRVLQPELLRLNIFVASLISSGEEEKGESLLHTPSLSLFSDALLRSLA